MDPVLVVTTLTTTAHAFLSIFPEIEDATPEFCMNWSDFLIDINCNIEVKIVPKYFRLKNRKLWEVTYLR